MPDISKNQIWAKFPLLQSSRLQLRAMDASADAADLLEVWGNPEVCRYTDFDPFDSEEKISKILKGLHTRFENHSGIRWGICLKPHPHIIGTIGFNTWKTHRAKTAEIGYDLVPTYWKQGIMSEALQLVLTYGFTRMKLQRIEATVDPANIASQRLLTKHGFKQEGLLRDYAYFKNRFHNLIMFSLLESEF